MLVTAAFIDVSCCLAGLQDQAGSSARLSQYSEVGSIRLPQNLVFIDQTTQRHISKFSNNRTPEKI